MNKTPHIVCSDSRPTYLVANKKAARGPRKSIVSAVAIALLALGEEAFAAPPLCNGSDTILSIHNTGITCSLDSSGKTLTVTGTGEIINNGSPTVDVTDGASITVNSGGRIGNSRGNAIYIHGTSSD